MPPKKALITGITGQDGSYLSELLLKKGYEVYGVVRRLALEDQSQRYGRISHLLDKPRLNLIGGDISTLSSMIQVILEVKPDEVYHLAAQSFVAKSFEDQFSTMDINVNGTHNILYAIKTCWPLARFYFAGSSEMFGKVQEIPQKETTAFYPRSIYGVSKVAGFDLTRNYREAYGLFACSGILFNHESNRRGTEFVTRKVSKAVSRIKLGKQDKLKLGNLDAKRDWGFSGDYVKAMYLMLQQSNPDDYVIATNETHSIKELCQEAFNVVGLDWEKYVEIDPKFNRPSDVELLIGDYSKANRVLGWEPTIRFKALVEMMVKSDLEKERIG